MLGEPVVVLFLLHDERKNINRRLQKRRLQRLVRYIYRNEHLPRLERKLQHRTLFNLRKFRCVSFNLGKDAPVFSHSNYPTIFYLHRVKGARFFLWHYFLFLSVIGPPTIHARQVRFDAHLKSNASQYPNSPVSATS